jgi:hypothetical protein
VELATTALKVGLQNGLAFNWNGGSLREKGSSMKWILAVLCFSLAGCACMSKATVTEKHSVEVERFDFHLP